MELLETNNGIHPFKVITGPILRTQLPGTHDITRAWSGTVMTISGGRKWSQTLGDRLASVHGVITMRVGIL